MTPHIREHKLPIGVTAGGLVVAAILAAAPALMAESDTEVLTKKNASEIQGLTTALETRTAELQQAMDAQSGSTSSAIDRLQNQVAILNKATGRMHRKQSTVLGPVSETVADLDSYKTNATTRLINLEKAVTRMNRRQKDLITAADNAPTGPDRNTDLRLANLEKAVKNIHLASVRQQDQLNSGPDPDMVLRLTNIEKAVKNLHQASVSQQQQLQSNDAEDLVAARMGALEKDIEFLRVGQASVESAVRANAFNSSQTNSMDNETAARLLSLERTLEQLQLTRLTSGTVARTDRADVRKRIESDLRILRIERQLKRIEARMDDLEGGAKGDDLMIDQLMEIRSYIDTLLSDIY